MSSALIITLEISGVLGVVLLLGGRELWLLRRDKKRQSGTPRKDQPPQP